MKYLLVFLLLFCFLGLQAQSSGSCGDWNLPQTKEIVYFKGLEYTDSLAIERDFFKNGFSLFPKSQGCRLIGYKVVSDCPDCDILAVDVCGEKMEQQKLEWLLKATKSNYGYLEIANITIEKAGQKYLARPFMIYLK